MEIIENRALLIRSRNPEQILTVIPKSKLTHDGAVLVHWGLEECQVLRNVGIRNVPSPITGRYMWPGSYQPFDHQKTTAAFLTMNRRAFCFNEQGTGKTGAAIWAADYLMTRKLVNRVLVICPLSIMDSAWRADIFKFAMHRTVDIAYGTKDKRKKILDAGTEFVVTNFDGVQIVHEELKQGGFDLIIVDEASAYKNPSTNRWKSLNKLLRPETWLWMMTGTPASQSPLDAYGLARLVNPNNVPKYMTTFRDQVLMKVTQYKWAPKPDAVATVHAALQPAIRFTKDECLDLPELTYVKRTVQLTKQQQHYYDMLKSKLVMEAAGQEITAANAAISLTKLAQIASGAVYTDGGDVVEFDVGNRYEVLKEVIAESSQKVLVFVPYRHTIAVIAEKLNTDGITTETINGDVPVNKRTDIFQRFQSDPTGTQVLVIQPQAAAHGVTLTAANTIVWWGPVSSLEIYAQANARVHRAGQRHPSTVVQLVGAPVERHIYALLDTKIDVHSKIVDLYKELLA